MRKSCWSLDNAVEIQKIAPYTFYRPSDAVIDQLIPGEAIVKLIFLFESDDPNLPTAERMWVLLEKINTDGTFDGKLDNDPFYIKDLKSGDPIQFGREHIIQYETLNDTVELEDIDGDKIELYLNKCFVSNHIINEGIKVGRLYRNEPEQKNETGWTLLSDKETKVYMEDSNNFQYVSIGTVLNLDDSFIHLLEAPVGSDFAKDERTGDFYSIEI